MSQLTGQLMTWSWSRSSFRPQMLLLMLKKKTKVEITQLTENHWWNVNLSILGSGCHNRTEYFLILCPIFWLPRLKIFFPSLQHGMATMHAGPKAYLIILITVPLNLKFVGTLLVFNSLCTCKLSSCHQTPNLFLCFFAKIIRRITWLFWT